MSRFELVITFSPIMIDLNVNNADVSAILDVLRLQWIVSKLLEVRLSNFEKFNDSKVSISILTVGPPIINSVPFISYPIGSPIISLKPPEPLSPIQPQDPLLCQQVRSCLKENNGVVLCEEGVGGTYFVHNENGQPIAVFKPTDEEPGAVNNPKKPLEKLLLPPGGGAIREVAAYLLDRNRAGVPETYLLSDVEHKRLSYKDGIEIPKTGSIQKFVPNLGNSAVMGTSRYSVENVHNIGILDIRLLNIDRNEENMLVVNKNDFGTNSNENGACNKDNTVKYSSNDCFVLVPIDHTYTLPYHLDDIYFGWMYWRQAKVPFSEESRKFISEIDVAADAKILRTIGIAEECIKNVKVSSILLKKGAENGLTLFQIATMICRKKKTEKSDLEILVDQAKDLEIRRRSERRATENKAKTTETKEEEKNDDDIEDLENLVCGWLEKKN